MWQPLNCIQLNWIELHYITFWLTLLLGWHWFLVDITFWLSLLLVDITFWLTLLFGWHYLMVDITFWLTLLFGWYYFLVDIALYCLVLKFHYSKLPGTRLKVCVWGGCVCGCWWCVNQLPCNPNLGWSWIELNLGWSWVGSWVGLSQLPL